MKLILLLALAAFSIFAKAEIKPVEPGSSADKVVVPAASSIMSIQDLKIGEIAFRLVGMTTGLNTDFDSTTILLVGEKGVVGGKAGRGIPFVLTPIYEPQHLAAVRKISEHNGKLLVEYEDGTARSVFKAYIFDTKEKVLIETDI